VNEPPKLDGLFEAHLTVRDLGRSIAFYRDVVGLTLALELPDRDAAFLWIAEPGRALLGLWSLGTAPVGLSLHVAFATSLSAVAAACERLRSLGVTPLSFVATETDEPSVIAWMPAAAVYFRDPDGHLLEYLAMLDAAPRPDLGVVTWSEWVRLTASPKEAPPPFRIDWHEGSRAPLRNLFELADDSAAQIDSYIGLGHVLVASDGEREIVGHLQLIPTAKADVIEIKSLAVRDGFRCRGLGTQLVKHALEWCRTEGARAATVTTAVADLDNVRFYLRNGFRASAIERDAFTAETGYPAHNSNDAIPVLDAIRFECPLARSPSRADR
jgi:lactoylglutathione lyase